MPRLSKKMKDMVTENMRSCILETSEKIILRDGLDALRMENIAKEADISAGSIYNYFKNKEEIIENIMIGISEGLIKVLNDIYESPIPVIEKLRQSACFMFEDSPRVRQLREALRDSSKSLHEKMRKGHRKLVDMFSKSIVQGINEGVFADSDPLLATSVLLGIIHELRVDPSRLFVDLSSQELADKSMEIYLTGMIPRA